MAAPASSYDYATRKGILPISWEDFHGLCKGIARAAAAFDPEIILAIGRGGFYPGTLIAHLLREEIYPVRLSRRVQDEVRFEQPRWLLEPPALVAGKRVLIVDAIASTGETLRLASERTRQLGAAEVRTAVLYAHSWGAEAADIIGLVSDALIINPWDREVFSDGVFQIHPEYGAALAHQNIAADALAGVELRDLLRNFSSGSFVIAEEASIAKDLISESGSRH